jgi:uncharacterized protein YbcI
MERGSGKSGQALTAVSTALVQLFREHYGRGPTKAKTYVYDDLVICVLREAGLTPFEKTMARRGSDARVLGLRRVLQSIIAPHAVGIVEELTGRRVRTSLADSSLDPDITVLTFVMDGVVARDLAGD